MPRMTTVSLATRAKLVHTLEQLQVNKSFAMLAITAQKVHHHRGAWQNKT